MSDQSAKCFLCKADGPLVPITEAYPHAEQWLPDGEKCSTLPCCADTVGCRGRFGLEILNLSAPLAFEPPKMDTITWLYGAYGMTVTRTNMARLIRAEDFIS